MDSQSDNEQRINITDDLLCDAVNQTDFHITSGDEMNTQISYSEIRKNLSGLIKTYTSQLDNLKSIYDKMSVPQVKRSAGTKKTKVEPQLNSSIIKESCMSLVSGLNTFSIPTLKTAIKNRFTDSYLRTDLQNPEQLGVSREEYNIHCIAMSNESLKSCAIQEKDIPTLVKRLFKTPEVYTVITKSGNEVKLDLSSFVGRTRQEIMTVLEQARWCEHRFDIGGSKLLLSDYILEVFAQVPVLKQYDILNNQEVYKTNEGFMKLLDLIRDTHELYFQYVETYESKLLLEQLNIPLINNYFKLDVVAVIAKERKYTQSLKEIESIKRTLTGVSEDGSFLIQ